VFSLNVQDNNICPCYYTIRLAITYRNAAVLCQSECACLHKIVKMVDFFLKIIKNTYQYPKGRVLMQMYRVVPQMKSENSIKNYLCNMFFSIFKNCSSLVSKNVPINFLLYFSKGCLVKAGFTVTMTTYSKYTSMDVRLIMYG